MSKKIVYKQEDPTTETEIRQAPKAKYQDSHELALEQITDLDTNFVAKMCGGTGTKIADVVIYDKITKEELYRFPMRVLSVQEEMEVYTESRVALDRLPKVAQLEVTAVILEMKARVRKSLMLRPDVDGKGKPEMGEESFRSLSLNQLKMLHEKYELLANIVSPCLDKMEEVDILTLIEEKKKDSNILTRLPRMLLEQTLDSCLVIIDSLRTDSSSSGESS